MGINDSKGKREEQRAVHLMLIFGTVFLTLGYRSYWNQCSSVTQSCLILWDPMDCSTPGFSVDHQPPEPAQAHVHWVSDAIQPSHPLLSPSPSAFNLSQHQGLSKYSVLHIRWPKYWSFSFTSVLPMNIQDWFPLEWTGLISLQYKGCSSVFSNTTVQKHQFSGTRLSLWSNSHIPTSLLEKT